jgi:chromosome partitioning protein
MQKGGVGKTSCTVNLADAIRRLGFRVLVIDMDPQANSSLILGLETPDLVTPSALELLLDPAVTLADVLQPSKYTDVSLVYSNLKLASAETILAKERDPDRVQLLQRKLRSANLSHHLALIDCPPSLSFLTMNALAAADHILIPLESGSMFSIRGADDLLMLRDSLKPVQPTLDVLGVIINKYNPRNTYTGPVVDNIRMRYGSKVFATTIAASATVRNAEMEGKTCIALQHGSKPARNFISLAQEILERVGLRKRPEAEGSKHSTGEAPVHDGVPDQTTEMVGAAVPASATA